MFQTALRYSSKRRPSSPIEASAFSKCVQFQGNWNAVFPESGHAERRGKQHNSGHTPNLLEHDCSTHTLEVNVATRPLRQTASIRPWYHSAESNLAKEVLLQLSWNATAKLPRCSSHRTLKDPRSRSADHIFTRPDNRRGACREVSRIEEPTFDARYPRWNNLEIPEP